MGIVTWENSPIISLFVWFCHYSSKKRTGHFKQFRLHNRTIIFSRAVFFWFLFVNFWCVTDIQNKRTTFSLCSSGKQTIERGGKGKFPTKYLNSVWNPITVKQYFLCLVFFFFFLPIDSTCRDLDLFVHFYFPNKQNTKHTTIKPNWLLCTSFSHFKS